MAEEVRLGSRGALFVGEDKVISVEVLTPRDEEPDATEAQRTPIDMSNWSVQLVVRDTPDASTARIDLAGTITGTYDADRATNTQRAAFTLVDTVELALATIPKGTYYYSVKRLNAGFETVLAFGQFVLERTTQV